jgi:LL-diaminopimelate aminotransferase
MKPSAPAQPNTTGHAVPGPACTPTQRLSALPPYVFAWLDELKAELRQSGATLIDLGIGNPDQPTPAAIVEEIQRAYATPATHGYPPFRGTPQFLDAAARYMGRRFGVTVDPATDVLCLSGAKEGIAHATMAFTDQDTVTLVPDIHYPVHARATGLTGGAVAYLPLRQEHGFVPRIADIPGDVLQRARVLVLNYPHNPTGAVAPRSLYHDAVALCRERGIVLLSDLAYAELTFDGEPAPSALEVPGAREVTLEFHSFSKNFNMAGSRIGFAVGGTDLVSALYAVRTNMGYGTPAAIQAGAAFALDHIEQYVPAIVERYRARRDRVVAGFRQLGWRCDPPAATMFVWLPVPGAMPAQQWTERLAREAGVIVTPGNAFGPGGEGYFRVSLVVDVPVLDEVFARLQQAQIRGP